MVEGTHENFNAMKISVYAVLSVYMCIMYDYYTCTCIFKVVVRFYINFVQCIIGSCDLPDLSEGDGEGEDVHSGVPIACASGEVTVRVKIKSCDSAPGPKLDVDVFVGVVHLLLSPHQLHTLTEMVLGLSGAGGESACTAVPCVHWL